MSLCRASIKPSPARKVPKRKPRAAVCPGLTVPPSSIFARESHWLGNCLTVAIPRRQNGRAAKTSRCCSDDTAGVERGCDGLSLAHHRFPPNGTGSLGVPPGRRGFSYRNIHRQRTLLNDGITALDRARSRLSWSRRELERFEQRVDEADTRTLRIRLKLQDDVEKAERDLRHAQGRYERVSLGRPGVEFTNGKRRRVNHSCGGYKLPLSGPS